MLIMLFACLYILFVSPDNPGGSGQVPHSESVLPVARIWEEDAGSAASTRSPPPSIYLSVSPAEGDGEEPQAGGTIPLHPSRQTLHRVAQLHAAALQGGVNASHKTAASSAHSGSSWTAKTTQPGEGREQGKGPAPTSFLPCYYY